MTKEEIQNYFEHLMDEAVNLGIKVNTDWAEEHSTLYDGFAYLIEHLHSMQIITDQQHDALALVAFYDYDDMKCDDEQMEEVFQLMRH